MWEANAIGHTVGENGIIIYGYLCMQLTVLGNMSHGSCMIPVPGVQFILLGTRIDLLYIYSTQWLPHSIISIN